MFKSYVWPLPIPFLSEATLVYCTTLTCHVRLASKQTCPATKLAIAKILLRTKASPSFYLHRYPDDDMGRPLSSQHATVHLLDQDRQTHRDTLALLSVR